MSNQRPRARFVPTLTEVVVSVVDSLTLAGLGDGALPTQAPALAAPASALEVAPSRSSMLEAAVENLLPQAREQLRQKLHAAAYALAEEQLLTMEDSLRQQLRAALREAAGMGERG